MINAPVPQQKSASLNILSNSINYQFMFNFFTFCSFLGSGPDRGQSPVEWGEIPFVRSSVCPSVPSLAGPQTLLAGPQTLLAGPQTPPAGPQTLPAGPQTPQTPQTPQVSPQTHAAGPQKPLAGPWMDGWMSRGKNGQTDRWTDGRNYFPFNRTLSPLGAAALLPSETLRHLSFRAREPLTI